MRYLSGLAVDIGSRPSNTEASLRAAEYVLSRLKGLGYDARLQPYTFSNFQDRSVQLMVRQPDQVEMVARTMVYSGRGTVEAPLVYCGLGRTGDFPTSDLRGRVALIGRGGGVSFQEKVSNAVSRGVAGVILFNDRTGELRGNLTQQTSVPAVGILQSDGQRLQEYLRRGQVVVGLHVDAYTETRQGSNVVATSISPSYRRKVVIGGHYDSVAAGPGANDNGSGIAVMMELASVLRSQRYPFDLVFVAFGDEEVGLEGSKKYVESLSADQKSQIIAMINLDMVGVGDSFQIGGDRDLAARAIKVAQQSGYPASEMSPRSGSSSDHASFQEVGIPAVFFHWSDDPNYHTSRDTFEHVLPSRLEIAGKAVISLLDDLRGSN